jgi:hypothetical protein
MKGKTAREIERERESERVVVKLLELGRRIKLIDYCI